MKITMLLGLGILLFLLGCNTTTLSKNQTNDGSKLTIVATFFPLYDLTKSIVGDKGVVESLVPANVEPHDYEVTPSDIKKVNAANAFVIMGIAFAPFEDNLKSSLSSSVAIISAAKDVNLLQISLDENKAGIDPHIWLSPKNAKKMAENIADGLIKVDKENQEYYKKNLEELKTTLDTLDTAFSIGLANCNKHVLLVNHNAFSYLGKEYGFTTIHINGLEPEVEPTPLQMKKLIDEAKKNSLKYIMYESLVDPRIAKTIASEVHAEVLELNPLEGTKDPSENYVSLMKKNLNNIKIALECT